LFSNNDAEIVQSRRDAQKWVSLHRKIRRQETRFRGTAGRHDQYPLNSSNKYSQSCVSVSDKRDLVNAHKILVTCFHHYPFYSYKWTQNLGKIIPLTRFLLSETDIYISIYIYCSPSEQVHIHSHIMPFYLSIL